MHPNKLQLLFAYVPWSRSLPRHVRVDANAHKQSFSRLGAAKVLACALLLMSTPCAAGADWGTPATLVVRPDGIVFFNTNGARTGAPACAATQPSRFVFTAAIAGGQALLSALQTAFARGKNVYVIGTGDCGVWGDTESVQYLQIQD